MTCQYLFCEEGERLQELRAIQRDDRGRQVVRLVRACPQHQTPLIQVLLREGFERVVVE